MEIACPNMAPVFVSCTLVTNSQNMLPILAEVSLSNLSTIISPDTSREEITASRPLNKISPVPEIIIFPTKEGSNIEEKRKKHGGNKFKEEKYRKCKQSQYFGSTTSENADKEIKIVIHIQEASEDSETKCISAGKTTCRHLTKRTGWDL